MAPRLWLALAALLCAGIIVLAVRQGGYSPAVAPYGAGGPLLLPDALGDREEVRMLAGTRCGVERWAVKTLTDPLAARVNLRPKGASIEDLAARPVPALWNRDARRLAQEMQAYTVAAELVAAKVEGDSDLHLVLRSGTGATMIAEIPNPSCVGASPVRRAVILARAAFIRGFGVPGRGWLQIRKQVEVTGVLFFDEVHGQTGVAPNGVELHPVIDLK